MPRRRTKKQYSFPVLKKKDIIGCFAELGINVTNSNLDKPDEQTCRFIYCETLQILMNIDVNRKSRQNENNYFEYPSLHQQSIINIRLFRDIIRFMVNIGVSDFGINDVIYPESYRTIRNLSAIINFAKFRNQKHRIYQQYKTQITELQQKLDKEVKSNQCLAAEFIKIKSKIDSDKPMVDNLQNQILELHTEIIKANDEMEAQDPVIHSIKRKIKSLQAKEKEQAVVLGKNLDKIREIESQIVYSPQRIKKELKSMSKHVQMEQIEVAKQQMVYRDDCKKLNAYVQLQQMVNDRIEEMKDTERAMKEYKEDKVVVDGLKNERRSVLRRMDEMKGNEQMMKNKLADKKEKYEALKIEKESKLEAVNKLFRQIEKKQDLRMRENLVKQKQIIECDQKIKSFEEEREKLIKCHGSNIRESVDIYKKISLAVHEYHNEMRQYMDKW